MKLMIIWGSSRTARKSGPLIDWVKGRTEADKRFEVDLVDLKELNLPFYDEPMGPYSLAKSGTGYSNPQGKTWAERVGRSDAVIIVTPEYNHGPSAVLKNALDWVGPELKDKPVGLISYGGVSGGIRAVEQLRSITIELGLINVANAIHFQFFSKCFDEQGKLVSKETFNPQLEAMFDEIERLHSAFHKSS